MEKVNIILYDFHKKMNQIVDFSKQMGVYSLFNQSL